MADSSLSTLRRAFTGRLLDAAADMAPYLTDYRGRWTGIALAVAEPVSTEDVGRVIRWCATHDVAVVPQGGNTGLSGGAVPNANGRSLLLSLKRLDRIRALDAVNNTITVEAGVTLDRAQGAARAADRLFPLSLAARGSCTVGGNLATNAGGAQVLRYGNARELCLGLEVVTANGDTWDGLRGLRKDNTGYDLRDLIVGSEGTLGVITAAVLKLFARPAAQVVAFAAVPSPADALDLLGAAQQRLGAGVTAFELLSEECLALVLRHMPSARAPLGTPSPWYVLLEVSDNESETHAQAAIESILAVAFDGGRVTDAAISASLAQFEALWALREGISDAQAAEGRTIKHDISLPISRIPAFIESTGAALSRAFPDVRTVVFGHLGDGNLHYNLSPARGVARDAPGFLELEAPANRLVHDAVVALNGSISAEHGLGVLRRDEAARYKSAVEIDLMRRIKDALDPRGILNPGKSLGPVPAGSQ